MALGKIITKNKKASFNFLLIERLEAGLCLRGTEIKSIREGKVNIAEAHIFIDKNDEAWIHNMHIAPYGHGNQFNHQELRKRKLLLHKRELKKLKDAIRLNGLTIVPTVLYLKSSKAKLEIATGKGKKLHDKRQDQAKKDTHKMIRRGIFE